jgi:hypothetical protein
MRIFLSDGREQNENSTAPQRQKKSHWSDLAENFQDSRKRSRITKCAYACGKPPLRVTTRGVPLSV